jgi:hypothetical protein
MEKEGGNRSTRSVSAIGTQCAKVVMVVVEIMEGAKTWT